MNSVVIRDPIFRPADLEDDAAATVALVRNYFPAFEPEFRTRLEIGWWSFLLPYPSGAQYQFHLHGEIGGERQISARLIQFAGSARSRRFWYLSLELAAFSDDADDLKASFHNSVKLVLTRPTRIIEKKGLIWLSYKAAYQDEAGWHSLGGDSYYLGLGAGIPFLGKKHIYSSPPLTNFTQT